MRVLSFKQIDKRKFVLCWTALLFDEHKLTAADRRVHGRIMDRFEGLSVSKDIPELVADGGQIALEETEFALLLRLVAETIWRPLLSREANALEDYLKQIPESKPE